MVDPIRYRFFDTVLRVEERSRRLWVSGVLNEAKFEEQSTGWWVIFSGGRDAQFFGMQEPDLKAGDVVDITIMKRPSEDPPGIAAEPKLPTAPAPAHAPFEARAAAFAMAAEPPREFRRAEAKAKGYEGEMCNDCGNFAMVRNGACLKCDACGATTGCS
jgi:hypothetical protein